MAVAAPVYVPTDTEVSIAHPRLLGTSPVVLLAGKSTPTRGAPVLTARYSIVASWLASKSLTSVVVCNRKYSGDS